MKLRKYLKDENKTETLERTPNIGVLKKEITEVIEEKKLSRKDIRIFINRVVHKPAP